MSTPAVSVVNVTVNVTLSFSSVAEVSQFLQSLQAAGGTVTAGAPAAGAAAPKAPKGPRLAPPAGTAAPAAGAAPAAADAAEDDIFGGTPTPPPTASKKVTLDEIKAAMQVYMSKNTTAKGKELLGAPPFSAKKLVDVPEAQYSALLAALLA